MSWSCGSEVVKVVKKLGCDVVFTLLFGAMRFLSSSSNVLETLEKKKCFKKVPVRCFKKINFTITHLLVKKYFFHMY